MPTDEYDHQGELRNGDRALSHGVTGVDRPTNKPREHAFSFCLLILET